MTPPRLASPLTSVLNFLLPVLTTAALLAIWEGLSASGALPAEIPPVSDVGAWLGDNAGAGDLWTAVGQTLGHWAVALLAGVVIGTAVGGAMAAIPVVNELLVGVVEFLRPIPVVVYLPIMLLMLGATSEVVVWLAAVAAVWPMLSQTFYGVRDVDPVSRDTARVFGLTTAQRLVWVTAPSVLPYVSTGVRIASTITLLVAIAMELIGAVPGLGATLGTYAANGVYDAMYGVIVLTGLLGVVLNAAFERIERRALRWHASHRTRNA
ncbi:ABC transporter permease [Streptomyces radicis]|uniref:ABC transporter permease subunit n=1 Tax=Streptomyces radicis TaxID=1750517 RepID=A0A3A9WDZ6_9ACTN|nr:ABC transporter permease subunit [Streptomyces radicis]RKN04247.1 ABC transporter permease subunit [Streptomyces radicis]RKN14765.1 ABC transporter permease subunit [Streptomyces radicis]